MGRGSEVESVEACGVEVGTERLDHASSQSRGTPQALVAITGTGVDQLHAPLGLHAITSLVGSVAVASSLDEAASWLTALPRSVGGQTSSSHSVVTPPFRKAGWSRTNRCTSAVVLTPSITVPSMAARTLSTAAARSLARTMILAMRLS